MTDTIFTLLVDLAEKEHLATSKRLAEANAKLTAALAQFDMLETYRRDYQHRLLQRTVGGAGGETLRNFNAFVGKLESAADLQRREVSHWQSRCAEIIQAEIAAKRKIQSFETLRDRRADEARQFEQVRTQKNQDEFAARFARDKQRRI